MPSATTDVRSVSLRGRRPLLGAVLTLALFAALAVAAVTSDRLPGDAWLTRQVQSIDGSAFTSVLDATADMAAQPLLIWIILALAVASGAVGGIRTGVIVLLLFAARALVPLFKEVIGQPRPSEALVQVAAAHSDNGFPSGHAFNAVLVYGFFSYVAGVYVRPPWLRIPVQAACAWVIGATCLQRVHSGAHWPSQVAGGALLAAFVLLLAVAAHRALTRAGARG